MLQILDFLVASDAIARLSIARAVTTKLTESIFFSLTAEYMPLGFDRFLQVILPFYPMQ